MAGTPSLISLMKRQHWTWTFCIHFVAAWTFTGQSKAESHFGDGNGFRLTALCWRTKVKRLKTHRDKDLALDLLQNAHLQAYRMQTMPGDNCNFFKNVSVHYTCMHIHRKHTHNPLCCCEPSLCTRATGWVSGEVLNSGASRRWPQGPRGLPPWPLASTLTLPPLLKALQDWGPPHSLWPWDFNPLL